MTFFTGNFAVWGASASPLSFEGAPSASVASAPPSPPAAPLRVDPQPIANAPAATKAKATASSKKQERPLPMATRASCAALNIRSPPLVGEPSERQAHIEELACTSHPQRRRTSHPRRTCEPLKL